MKVETLMGSYAVLWSAVVQLFIFVFDEELYIADSLESGMKTKSLKSMQRIPFGNPVGVFVLTEVPVMAF